MINGLRTFWLFVALLSSLVSRAEDIHVTLQGTILRTEALSGPCELSATVDSETKRITRLSVHREGDRIYNLPVNKCGPRFESIQELEYYGRLKRPPIRYDEKYKMLMSGGQVVVSGLFNYATGECALSAPKSADDYTFVSLRILPLDLPFRGLVTGAKAYQFFRFDVDPHGPEYVCILEKPAASEFIPDPLKQSKDRPQE